MTVKVGFKKTENYKLDVLIKVEEEEEEEEGRKEETDRERKRERAGSKLVLFLPSTGMNPGACTY